MIDYRTDIATTAIGRILWQWRRGYQTDSAEAAAPRMVELVKIAGEVVQDLEDQIQDLIFDRFLAVAVGAQLDQYGSILTEPRRGLSDEDYRAILTTRIKANRSNGTPDEMLEILEGLFGGLDLPIQFIEWFPAAVGFVVFTDGPLPSAAALQRIDLAMQRSAPAGVRVHSIMAAKPKPFAFDEFAGARGFDQGPLATNFTRRWTE